MVGLAENVLICVDKVIDEVKCETYAFKLCISVENDSLGQ